MLDGIQCPSCKSENIKKDGFTRVGIQRFKCNDCQRYFSETTMIQDQEIVEENVKLAKKTQKFADSNRIERKSFREYARIENAIAEYNKELIKILEENSIHILTKKHENKQDNLVLLVQLSDCHFNELVSIPGNRYDFSVASKRLKKFSDKILQYVKAFKISEIVLAITGDLINSDRRLDELLSKATNRAKASFMAVDLIQQFIMDLNKVTNISVVSVTGNESRVNEEMGFSEIVATDNYDYTIFQILKKLFKNKDGINFINSDPMEALIKIGAVNILLTHGYDSPKEGTQKFIQQLIGKYAQKNILVNYVIFGHLHSCYISDTFSRSGSLVGSNTYNEFALNLYSRASQNIYFVDKSGSIDALKIDLQDVSGVSGYEVEDLGDVYNAKSDSKAKATSKKVVFEVVI